MFKKILLYGLPLYLYGLEFLLKAFASIKADSVAGPSLAGAGLGFLLPLTDLKPVSLDADVMDELRAAGAGVYSPRDKTFSDFVWLCFFLSLGAWMLSIYWTLKPLAHPSIVNRPLLIGCIIFLVSITLAEIKERI
ncbi:MAG TPA: hypothetical protein VMD78_07895 [Candidatus Baltobacteraceae bacterium]|nr:hypothetical protein [Candidatus Baltobacteraceae bacterium]